MSRFKFAMLAVLGCAASAYAQTDSCASATPVGLGTVAFDTSAATNDGTGSCGASAASPDVWVRYTAGATANIVFDTCGSSYDTCISLFTACGGTELACNDDSGGFGNCQFTLQSYINYPVTAGTTYFVRLAGYAGSVGAGVLNIGLDVPPPPPANDLCTAATAVGEGTFPFNNLGADDDGNGASCGFGGSPGYQSIWYRYTPSFTGNASVSTCGQTTLDSLITIVDGPCGNEIACAEDSCGLQSNAVFATTAGVPVWVRLASYGDGVTGSGTFTISSFVTPANDNCADAIALTVGVPASFDTGSATNDGPGSCGASAGSADVWFSYNTGANPMGGLLISTCGSPMDTVLSVFDGCSGAEIACLDDGCGFQTPLQVCSVSPNQDLRIRVAGFGGETGTGDIVVTETPAAGTYSPPAGCTAEGEDCNQIFPDNYNGGCNSDPVIFQDVELCTDYCATGALSFDIGFRDTDWFRLSLPQAGTLSYTGNSQREMLVWIFDTACPGISLAGPLVTAGCTLNWQLDFAAPGAMDVILFAAPNVGATNVNCGVDADYYFRAVLDTQPCPAACDPDFNCDGNPDQDDVACLINVVAGNPGCECQDPDFNRDGNVDQDDVAALINVVAGGNCP